MGGLETSGLGMGGLGIGGGMGCLGSSGHLDNMNGGSCAQGSNSQSSSCLSSCIVYVHVLSSTYMTYISVYGVIVTHSIHTINSLDIKYTHNTS